MEATRRIQDRFDEVEPGSRVKYRFEKMRVLQLGCPTENQEPRRHTVQLCRCNGSSHTDPKPLEEMMNMRGCDQWKIKTESKRDVNEEIKEFYNKGT